MNTSGKAAALAILAPLITLSSAGFAHDDASVSGAVSVERPRASRSNREGYTTGRLPNGVRFAILSRKSSEPGVAVLMRNEGGFIAERRPGERGLAHLIEHVAFHSPTVAAPEDYDHLRRIGVPLTLPAPNAGSTSWRETNYYLSTRTTASSGIDALLALFREVASDMTLRADAVDASRAEVVREMADKRLGNEIYASYVAAIAPGSPNDVIEAQNSDDVPIASVDAIRGLYERLYRPENMMIVIVGDVEPDKMKALIAKRFSDWRREPSANRTVSFPMFERARIRPISFSTLPEGRRTALMTVVLHTPASPTSPARQARADLMDLIVTRAINKRLVALQPASRPGKVGMLIDNGEQGQRQILLWDNFDKGDWKPAVAGLIRVTCDLTASGFTAVEWSEAERAVTADLEQRTADMAKVSNVDLAKDLSHTLADGRYPMSSASMLIQARRWLSRINHRSGNSWWHRQWGGGVEHIRVEAPELAKTPDPLGEIRRVAAQANGLQGCAMS